jgi:hypothetical protein
VRFSRFPGNFISAALFFFLSAGAVSAEDDAPPVDRWITRPESGFIAPAHRGAVNCIVYDEDGNILTAGNDGFLVVWDGAAREARERFQLSSYAIEKIALRPGKHEIAVYESNGAGFYRVSVWDYAEKKRRYSISITNPLFNCAYTAFGTYLLLCFSNGVALVDSDTGNQRGNTLGEYPVSLAISSRTERTLQVYSPAGALSYWDLGRGVLSQSFSVPNNLRTPVVFGNYRFLAGQNDDGLFVVDAVSGKILFQTEAVRGSMLLCADYSGDSFFRLAFDSAGSSGGNFRREDFTVESGVVRRGEIEIPVDAGIVVSAAAPLDSSRFLIGVDDGGLVLINDNNFMDGGAAFFLFKNQNGIFDAASVNDTLAFIDKDGRGAFIPADFNELAERDSIDLFNANSANRIAADANSFLFWHYGEDGGGASFTESEHNFPFTRRLIKEYPPYEWEEYVIDNSGMRKDLRGAAVSGDKILFLNVLGEMAVFSIEQRRRVFSYTSALSLDAVFIDDRNILIANSADIGGNTAPFLLVDNVSGETLPVNYPALMAFALYKSALGNVYGAVLKNTDRHVSTEIVRFNALSPESSSAVFEYDGEDANFSFIEYSVKNTVYLVNSAGGEDAYITPAGDFRGGDAPKAIGRSPAFPQKLLPQNDSFAALDGDGSIVWYDGESGKPLAMLRIYKDEWLLSTSSGKIERGIFTPVSE